MKKRSLRTVHFSDGEIWKYVVERKRASDLEVRIYGPNKKMHRIHGNEVSHLNQTIENKNSYFNEILGIENIYLNITPSTIKEYIKQNLKNKTNE